MNATVAFDTTCGLCAFTLTVAGILLYKQRTTSSRRRESYFDKIWKPSPSFDEYFPPLPDEVVEVLRTSKLCYLATQSDGNPHLSLMNFTYCRKEEVLILSTRRNTKKFYQIIENPKVAVLIHDFPAEVVLPSPSASGESTGAEKKAAKQWSITLNGVAEVTTAFFFTSSDFDETFSLYYMIETLHHLLVIFILPLHSTRRP